MSSCSSTSHWKDPLSTLSLPPYQRSLVYIGNYSELLFHPPACVIPWGHYLGSWELWQIMKLGSVSQLALLLPSYWVRYSGYLLSSYELSNLQNPEKMYFLIELFSFEQSHVIYTIFWSYDVLFFFSYLLNEFLPLPNYSPFMFVMFPIWLLL